MSSTPSSSASPTDTHVTQDGDTRMLEITQLATASGSLTKTIRLSDDGRLVSDGSSCLMTSGTAHRLRLGGMRHFAEAIHGLQNHQAIALGALDPSLPDQVDITTRRRLAELNGHASPHTIARTAQSIRYRRDQVSLALLDFDTKEMPAAIGDRIKRLGGFWAASSRSCPRWPTPLVWNGLPQVRAS